MKCIDSESDQRNASGHHAGYEGRHALNRVVRERHPRVQMPTANEGSAFGWVHRERRY